MGEIFCFVGNETGKEVFPRAFQGRSRSSILSGRLCCKPRIPI